MDSFLIVQTLGLLKQIAEPLLREHKDIQKEVLAFIDSIIARYP